MKKCTFFFAAALVLLATSCNGDLSPEENPARRVNLTVNVDAPYTRATVTEGLDMTLKNFQVFVFSDGGKFEDSSSLIIESSQVSMSIIPGNKRIWVLANLNQALSGITRESALINRVTSLSSNVFDKFIMSGSEQQIVTVDKELTVSVQRLACKVVLDKITRDFTNKSYAEVPMKIKRIYMSNVVGDCDYGCSMTPTIWYNKLGVVDATISSEVRNLILDEDINTDLPDGSSYEHTHTFDVYPNPTTTDTYVAPWSPRHTRLVIECEYNNQTCYYPITIPKANGSDLGVMTRNTEYHIGELILKRPGSIDPDKPTDEVSSKINATFTITISPWGGGGSYTEQFI